jgi:hypothetical protein
VGVALRDESRGQLEMDTAAKSIAGLAAWHDVTNGEPIAIHCSLSLSRKKIAALCRDAHECRLSRNLENARARKMMDDYEQNYKDCRRKRAEKE